MIIRPRPASTTPQPTSTMPRPETTRRVVRRGGPVVVSNPPAEAPPGRRLVEIRNETGDDYMRLSQIDHVYLVQDTYVGSDQQNERDAWLLEAGMTPPTAHHGTITIPHAVERLFLEIISNAGDNVLRSRAAGVDPGSIEITMDTHTITVRNGGKPIIIKKNIKEQMWDPELIFGVLLTSSNYDTSKTRVGCGRNGLGSKATSIFSKRFTVSIGDPTTRQTYYQEWSDNMKAKTSPVISAGYTGSAYVEISYTMDFARFGYSPEIGYPPEAMLLFRRYTYDYSQNIQTRTTFNGEVYAPTFNPKDHGKFYFGDVPMALHYEWPTGTRVTTKKNGLQQAEDPMILPTSVLILADTPNRGQSVSFVNGMYTSDGGVHVNEAMKAVAKPLLDIVNTRKTKKGKVDDKADRKLKLTWKDVHKHVSILLVCHLDDPQFGGQMKEKLVKPIPKFLIPSIIPDAMSKWSLVLYLSAMADDKIGKMLASTNGKKKRHIDSGKGRDAYLAGGPKSQDCMLFVVEGDSAKQYAYIAQGLIPQGHDYIGVLPLKGKPLNVLNAMAQDPRKIADNHEISELKKFLGLTDFADYTQDALRSKLRYGRLVILADADDDGTHIKSLIILLFHCFYPSLFQYGYVSFLRTPLIRIVGTNISFNTDAEYQLWCRDTPNYTRHGPAKYYKGLGSSVKDDIRKDVANPCYVTCQYDTDDATFTAAEALDLAFNRNRADDRKDWLKSWNYTLEDLNIGRLEELPISEFIDKELAVYAQTSLRRAIPSMMDGLKEGQRKILWGAYRIWGSGKMTTTKKVSGLGAYVVEHLEYHHGEACLDKSIIAMAQTFVGSNNMNYLYPDGLFGSRVEGGKDASAGRYICTKLESWFSMVFRREDMDLLQYRTSDGQNVEPTFLLPIIPMALVNGAHGVAVGSSTHIPNHDPMDVSAWLRARLRGEALPVVLPWYRGFTGQITIRNKKGSGKTELRDDDEIADTQPGLSAITQGCFTVTSNRVDITELPIGVWTNRYKEWLDSLLRDKKITDYKMNGDEERVQFQIYGFSDPSYKNLRLTKSFGLTNMVLIDQQDRPHRHDSIADILEAFYHHRLPYYAQRKDRILTAHRLEISRLDAKARYIQAIRDRLIDLNADDATIEAVLVRLNIPSSVRDLKTRSLAQQGVEAIRAKMAAKEAELASYSRLNPEEIWHQDLLDFEAAWKAQQAKTARRSKIVRRTVS